MRLAIRLLVLFAATPTASLAAESAIGEADIAALVEQLGHPLYEERLDAHRRLLDIGLDAFDVLRDALADSDPEVADASRRLLNELTADWTRRDDAPRVRQWLAAYNTALVGRDLDVVEALAELPGEQAIPALVRLARFDPTDLGSAEAARAVLATRELQANRRRDQAIVASIEKLTEEFGPGRRPAAQWLALAAEEASSAPAPIAEWRRHFERQRSLYDTSSIDTSEAVVATLAWRWLRASLLAGDDREAVAATDSLVGLSDEEALGRLARGVRWAAEAQRWDAVNKLLSTHADRLDGKRGLYLLAEVAARQGDKAEADRLAAQALTTPPSADDATIEDVLLGPQVMVARDLYEVGQLEWAIAEYRAAAVSDDPLDGRAAVAAWRLANLLFDVERYDEAAAALEPIAEAIDRSRPARGEYDNLPQEDRGLLPTSGDLIARQRFSAALAARAAGDHDEEMTLLRKAIAASPSDADVLIAMHRVEGAPDAFLADAKRRIDERRREFEREIWENPDEADGYNQWAWLVSNTYGDYDKAVRYSRRSLQIMPETAGYLDTLGRCLYSAGHIEEAVETQRRAVELEPRMQVLQRQLDEFERAASSRRSGESEQDVEPSEPIL